MLAFYLHTKAMYPPADSRHIDPTPGVRRYEPSIEYQANPTGDCMLQPLHHSAAVHCVLASCSDDGCQTSGDPDHAGRSITWGNCGHVFHLDCIQRWLKTRSACPLCNKEWEFAKIEKITAVS